MDLEISIATKNDLRDIPILKIEMFSEALGSGVKTSLICKHIIKLYGWFSLRYAAGRRDIIIVARQSGNLIGYLKSGDVQIGLKHPLPEDHAHMLQINRFYVTPAFRGQGVGRALLGFFLKIAQDHDITKVYLGVGSENNRATRFYKKNGFKLAEHFYTQAEHARARYNHQLIMCRALKPSMRSCA